MIKLQLTVNSSVLLQTADIIVENQVNKKRVKAKVLFEQGSQRSYVTERLKHVLNLNSISQESISLATFGSEKTKKIYFR